MRRLLLFLAGLPGILPAADFGRDIRPLLERRCVECHGPAKQKGDLRLDARVFAFKGGHDGPALVAGNPAASPLFQRVISDDTEERMPAKADPLPAEEVALLKAWIEAGAPWPEDEADRVAAADPRRDHWSVRQVRKDFPADAKIDGFIAARLAAQGLVPAPSADRRTLIRRLTFDLHGLPPDPRRVERFVADPDPAAYERLVDELLASPHYGERWARHWLDIAHYADTHGFERDQLRPHAWRYRDWVIDALNAGMPYDRFLQEQIAGDVIAPGDPAALVATGFLAAGPWDFVGHVETKSDQLKRAARAGDLDDMVTQVVTATMGVTIHCARCHDHKLDPIPQRDYYRLWSVFSGVRRDNREVDATESRRLRAERERLRKLHAGVQAELLRLSGEVLDLADMVGGGDGHGSGKKGAGLVLETGESETTKLGLHRNVKPNRLAPNRIALPDANASRFVKGVFLPNGGPDGKGRIALAPDVVLKDLPPTSGLAWDAVRNGRLNAQAHARIDGVDYEEEGRSVLGLHANAAVVFDLAALREAYGLGALRLTGVVGFGAKQGAAPTKADFAVYLDAERVVHRAGLAKTESLALEVPVPAGARFLTLMATDGGDGVGSDLLFIGDARLRSEAPATGPAGNDRARIAELNAAVAAVQRELRELPEAPQVFAIRSTERPPPTRMHRRGDPEDEGAAVLPGAFTWAGHAPADFGDDTTPEGERRRRLADWITHPDNPLTPRVLVNRLWHHHFGQGIVATPSDFGLGGSPPSHPELLDWLAAEFLRSGGSLKHLHRLIVTSAAYRRDSRAEDPAAVRVDAQNRLLWRQNPRRLDAESLRDAVLTVAGTLNPERGGPGYRDFKYTEAYAPLYDYVTPDEPALWRRSIYRFIVRTTPHQFLSTLDCPDPANLTPARVRTTTALQALALANNDFMLRQARRLAERAEREAGAGEAAVRRAIALAFQRDATPAEARAGAELAAARGLFAVCRALLNANEFVHID